MAAPGPLNRISDIAGFSVGHAEDPKIKTGVTVLRCAKAMVASVDVRGGGPGVRETETLKAENLVAAVDAIVLAGGSVFGLAAADGVTNALSQAGTGLKLSSKSPAIPIVPAAVLHDLGNDGDKNWGETPPYAQLGRDALAACTHEFTLGAVGAGLGARAGVVAGGIGSSSVRLDAGLTIGALVAANPVGSCYYPDGTTLYAKMLEANDEMGGGAFVPPGESLDPIHGLSKMATYDAVKPGANTTIGIVACDADLTAAECKRVAMIAHDGIARAVRPAHLPFDGDVVFALASGETSLPTEKMPRSMMLAQIGAAAADCLTRAIGRAVYEAAKG